MDTPALVSIPLIKLQLFANRKKGKHRPYVDIYTVIIANKL